MISYELIIILLAITALVGIGWPFISYVKGFMETSGRIDALRKKSPNTKHKETNGKEES